MILYLRHDDFLPHIFSPELVEDYEPQFYNSLRNTLIDSKRRIICYNQTINDDMHLEVSEYFGLTLSVERRYSSVLTIVQPMYDEVAIQILDNDSKCSESI